MIIYNLSMLYPEVKSEIFPTAQQKAIKAYIRNKFV